MLSTVLQGALDVGTTSCLHRSIARFASCASGSVAPRGVKVTREAIENRGHLTSTPCVQRFHPEEILSEGAKILSRTPKFECGVSARYSLARKEAETQSGHVSTMRVWVWCRCFLQHPEAQ